MVSQSDLVEHGYKELSNVMEELKQWPASLMMPIKICNMKGEFFTETYDDTDILQYTSDIGKGYKLYFDICKYPIENGFKSNSNGWKELHRVLRLQAQGAGYDIVSNGCPTKNSSNQRRICCRLSIMYFNKKHTISDSYRGCSLKNDRKNSRGKIGRRMPRRTASALPISLEQKCGMFFIVSFDENGYYMIGGRGCCNHQHHMKLTRCQTQTRIRHLSSSDVEIITDIGIVQAKNSIGANVFYVRSGQVISRSQVRYLSGFYSQGTNYHFLDEEFSDADKLISLLENQRHSHVVLYHQHNSDPNHELVSEIKMKNSTKPVNALQDLDEQEVSEMHTYIAQNHGVMMVQPTQALMIGVAWVTMIEK